MTDLKIDTAVKGLSTESADLAAQAESFGFDGVFTPETDEDPFLPLPLVADQTTDIEIGTRIATSFTRSPMVLAYQAWDLQRFTDGRMILGLGTQVKGHNERRFSVDFEWESPGSRLREEVIALKHIFDVFQGNEDELDFDGEFFQFSLMTDEFNPGPLEAGPPDIWVAGVSEYMLKMAGDVSDGLCMHAFNTPKYTEEVIVPTVEEGAEIGGRDPNDVTLSASPFLITGETEERRAEMRQEAKQRIAFYGSTRTYHDVLELHGWKDVGMELHELSKEGKWDEMTELVTDEMVAAFAIEAEPDTLAEKIEEKYGGVADRIQLSFDGSEYWSDVLEELKDD
ncbi:probable F420-dependent oxidoreductase, MSMEG_2256 family [Natronorubrum sediminis]|uniref:Probable F420-dependent oxidoreductase, MSMEG_2256 family n=1 Tax=Natronorubrum sediminis TaxID=640943 RepID=A0A1H6G4K4_9EURY|nr:TIGR03617 family F420-dependent LLM class oxidoreductase [Natronorubrum sediminis]SEH17253.1 probable F420-dependent oxidoreductase, MSMEG_2256 family [Natronorubrum sediminis]